MLGSTPSRTRYLRNVNKMVFLKRVFKEPVMESKAESHVKTNTTVRANANYWPFSCGFFCSRVTDSDVIEPKKKKEEEKECKP